MMKFPSLKIGRLAPRYPIIQGGMAIRVSTAPLATAVANAGGIGIIAATGMSLDELRNEIRTARRNSKGIIGINIMFAVRQFAALVHTAIEEKIDLIITGAGFSRDIFKWGRESDTPIVSIVSSAKLAKIAEFYAEDARVDGFDVQLSGLDDIRKYWRNLKGRGVDWIWEIDAYGGNDLFVIQTGLSHLTLAYGADHITYSSAFSVVWRRQDNGEYKIYSDFYRFHDQLRYRAFDIREDSVRIIAG